MASVLRGDRTKPLSYGLIASFVVYITKKYWKQAPDKAFHKNSLSYFFTKLTSQGASRSTFSLAHHEVLLVLG